MKNLSNSEILPEWKSCQTYGTPNNTDEESTPLCSFYRTKKRKTTITNGLENCLIKSTLHEKITT